MKRSVVFLLLVFLLIYVPRGVSETILRTDFSDWTVGAIDGSYSLPSGWVLKEAGLVVATDQVHSGTKSLKSPHESSGAIQFVWTPFEPTTAVPFRITFYTRLGASGKVQKGLALYDQNMVNGLNDPVIYWYEHTISPIGSRLYRVRDRAPSSPTPVVAMQVYGSVPTTFEMSSNNLRSWVKWQLVCTDLEAKLYRNDILVFTFNGPANSPADNYAAIEIGSPKTAWLNEYDGNGDIWFDDISIERYPYEVTPTPVVPTPTQTVTPTHTPGPLRIDPYGGKPINRMLIGQNPRRGDSTRHNTVAISRNGCVRGVAGGLDADTYTWTDLTTGVDARNPNVSTLEFLRDARDMNAEPLLTANVLGPGYRDGTTWFCQTPPEGWLEDVASSWVLYTNVILQNYRQGDVLPPEYQNLLDSFNWLGKENLLSATEPLTPRVIYWEIGNEPELGDISGYIQNHYLSPSEFKQRYKAIASAMRAVDPSIKLGPCTLTPNSSTTQQYLAQLLSDPTVPVNFLGFHPYYLSLYYTYLNHWTSPDVITRLESDLRNLKAYQESVRNSIVHFMGSNGFDTNIPWIASEWNSSDWRGTWTPLGKCMTHALGVAEGVFVFAELGYLGAHYWEQPSVGPQGYKMFQALQDHMGEHLVNSYTDGDNFRLYTTRFKDWSKFVLWGINFSDTQDKQIDLGFSFFPFAVRSITKMKLGVVGDDTGLKSSTGVDWEASDITGIDLRDFTITFEDATVTAIIIETEGASVCSWDYD